MAFFTYSRTLPLAALLAAASFTGCKKDSTETKPPIEVPAAPDYILPVLPTAANGQLLSITHDFRFYEKGVVLSDKYPTPLQSVTYQTVKALFRDATGPQAGSTYVDAGAVSVNGITLDKAADNTYSRTDNFNFNQGLQYNVAGNGGVTAFPYAIANPQPTYTGNIPTQIDRKLTLTIPLGGSNISGADSVIVILRSGGAKVVRRIPYSTIVSGSATSTPSVVLQATEMNDLPNALAESNTAFIQVMVFRTNANLLSQGGRSYAITRETILTVPVRFFKSL